MADLARLKSQIAIFAGLDPSSDATVKDGAMAKFLRSLDGFRFDAIHIQPGRDNAIYGNADDLRALATMAAKEDTTDATALICAIADDFDRMIFCGTKADEVIILRAHDIGLNQLLSNWRDVQ